MMNNDDSSKNDNDININAKDNFMSAFRELSTDEMIEVVALIKQRIRLLESEAILDKS